MIGKSKPILISIILLTYRSISIFLAPKFHKKHGDALLQTLEDVFIFVYDEDGKWKLLRVGLFEIANLLENIFFLFVDNTIKRMGLRWEFNMKALLSTFEHPLEVAFLFIMTASLAVYNYNYKSSNLLEFLTINLYVAAIEASFLFASIFRFQSVRDISLQAGKPSHFKIVRPRSFLKDFLDYVIVLPSLLLIGPLFIMIAIAVILDSPGPIFHRRRVLGLNGRIFYAYKFRTMHVNGYEILGKYPELQKELKRNYRLKSDPRVTRVGAWLRKFSLDELPQLLNIISRDMSIVGPRIIAPDEITKYGRQGQKLVTAMPGLTGLWQISGRSYTSYDERVRLDMQYIDNWSIWLDIKILFGTVPAVLKGDGAY
jgi:lipopolysaccharide/colanic/teichoic acid biosynthesis glycosyltransferase